MTAMFETILLRTCSNLAVSGRGLNEWLGVACRSAPGLNEWLGVAAPPRGRDRPEFELRVLGCVREVLICTQQREAMVDA